MPTPEPMAYGWRVRWKHSEILSGRWQQVSFRRADNDTFEMAEMLCEYLDQVVLRKIADTDDRIVARVYLRAGALEDRPAEASQGVLTLRILLARYEDTRSRSEHTQENYDGIKRRYFADWMDKAAVLISQSELRRKYDALIDKVDGFGLEPSTARTALNVVAPALRWAFRRGMIPDDPTDGCRFLTRPTNQFFTNDKPLTEVQYRSILDRATGLVKLIFWLLAETGIRLGELFALNIEDLDLDRRRIHVRHHMVKRVRKPGTKSGSAATRSVPIGYDLAEALRAYLGHRVGGPVFLSPRRLRLGNPRFYREVWGPLVTAVREAGLIPAHQPLHPHVLRHSFATWRAHSGEVSAFQLMTLMGHSQLTTTQHYYGSEAGAADAGQGFLDRRAA